MERRQRLFRAVLLLAAFCIFSSGCATYSDHIETVRTRVSTGDYRGAVDELNGLLDVDSTDELPDSWGSETSLAILERGSLLQALEEYKASARDLGAGETELELLDYKDDTAGTIGKYVYSDSAADYQTPPSERLALSAVNMLNFLALGDFAGAAVEVRNFQVMREYLESVDLGRQGIFGSYVAGLTFERLGQADRALLYYEEAMAAAAFPTLREPVIRLAGSSQRRGPRVRELIGDAPTPYVEQAPSEIVTVVSLGRVPHKVPERMPVGAAIGIAGTFITGNPQVLARSIFKVVVYPDLKGSGSLSRNASVEIDGAKAPIDRISSVGADITKEYDRLKPQIIGAALTRMITRAIAAEGARYAGRQAGGNAGAIIGLLAALGTEAALVGLDKPDTRSWTMLADHVFVSRQVVKPGKHTVKVAISGASLQRLREFSVDVPPGQAVVVVATEPQ